MDKGWIIYNTRPQAEALLGLTKTALDNSNIKNKKETTDYTSIVDHPSSGESAVYMDFTDPIGSTLKDDRTSAELDSMVEKLPSDWFSEE